MDSASSLKGLGRQGILNAAATVLPGLYMIAATGAILRTVGAESYGPWAMAVVMLGWLSLLDLGLAQTTVRAAARALAGDREAVGDVLAAGSLYACLAVVGGVIGIIFAFVIPGFLGLSGEVAEETSVMTTILAVDAAIVLATASWSGVLRGGGRFGSLFVASLVQVSVAIPLLVFLLPTLGLPGAAVAQVGGRLASRGTMAALLYRQMPWFRAVPTIPERRRMTRVFRFSAPIFLMQLGTQLGSGTDVLIVGMTSGAATVGLYAAGAQIVRFAAYFVFPLIDVVFPRLAALDVVSPHRALMVLLRSLLLGGAVGTVAFGGLALESSTVLRIWAGEAAPLSVSVLVLYACAYVIITPAHLLVISLVARGRHRTVAVVILSEAIVNVALSVLLVRVIGPIGPAVSTLIVVLIDDIFVIPFLASRRLAVPLSRLLVPALSGVVIGMGILMVGQLIPGDTATAVAARGVVVVGLLVLVVAIGLRRPIGNSEEPHPGDTGQGHPTLTTAPDVRNQD